MVMFVGVDPGISGAVAIIDGEGKMVDTFPIPTIKPGKSSMVDSRALHVHLAGLLDVTLTRLAAIEKVGPMPKQGVVSTFNFGCAYGSIIGVIAGLGIKIINPTPATWKKRMGVTGDKEKARAIATLMFPEADLHRKADHNRAEALLLAEYARINAQ